MIDYTKAEYFSLQPADEILVVYTGSFDLAARPGIFGTTRGVIYQVAEALPSSDTEYSTPFSTLIFSTDGGTTWYPQQNEIGLVNGQNTVGTVMATPMTFIGTTPPTYIYATNGTAGSVTITYKLAVFASSVNNTVTGLV